jgi:integrase
LDLEREAYRGKLAPVQASTSRNVTVRSRGPRDYLTEREVERLMDAARDNRWGQRDATAILLAYRHGLRASELVALRWDDIDFRTAKLHVRRAKGGMASVHPLGAKELRALRRLQRATPEGQRRAVRLDFKIERSARREKIRARARARSRRSLRMKLSLTGDER